MDDINAPKEGGEQKKSEENYPELKSNVGRGGKTVKPDTRVKSYFTIEDEIQHFQSGRRNKILCLQKLKFEEDQRVELRFGYYIIGKLPRYKGQWVWGQYSPHVPIADFVKIYEEAEKRGWFTNK